MVLRKLEDCPNQVSAICGLSAVDYLVSCTYRYIENFIQQIKFSCCNAVVIRTHPKFVTILEGTATAETSKQVGVKRRTLHQGHPRNAVAVTLIR